LPVQEQEKLVLQALKQILNRGIKKSLIFAITIEDEIVEILARQN